MYTLDEIQIVISRLQSRPITETTVLKKHYLHLLILHFVKQPYPSIQINFKEIKNIYFTANCNVIASLLDTFNIKSINTSKHNLQMRTGVTQKCAVPVYLFCVPKRPCDGGGNGTRADIPSSHSWSLLVSWRRSE